MSRTLVIGTSSPALSLALFEGDVLLAHHHEEIGRGHAEALVPAIAALPGRGRACRILVDVGPGSFTGVRVGLAAARALSLVWRAEVVGVEAPLLVAAGAPQHGALTVLLDAGRGQLICQRVGPDWEQGAAETLTPARAAALPGPFAGAGARLLPEGAGPVLHDGQPDARHALDVPARLRGRPAAACYLRPPDAVLPL